MQGFDIFQAIASLLVVVGGILAVAWFAQRFALKTALGKFNKGPHARNRSQILMRLPGRRSIIEVHCDDRRYHLLIAADHSLVLDSRPIEASALSQTTTQFAQMVEESISDQAETPLEKQPATVKWLAEQIRKTGLGQKKNQL